MPRPFGAKNLFCRFVYTPEPSLPESMFGAFYRALQRKATCETRCSCDEKRRSMRKRLDCPTRVCKQHHRQFDQRFPNATLFTIGWNEAPAVYASWIHSPPQVPGPASRARLTGLNRQVVENVGLTAR